MIELVNNVSKPLEELPRIFDVNNLKTWQAKYEKFNEDIDVIQGETI